MQPNNKKKRELVIPNDILLPEVIDLINKGHTVTIRLKGYSMRPFLEDDRDKAILGKVGNLCVGDAVLAEISPKKYVLHRIVKIEGEHVTLQGDGNLYQEHCKTEDIKASVIGFFRKGRSRIDYTTGIKWKVYSWLWMKLVPIRRYLLAFYRRIWLKLFKTRLK